MRASETSRKAFKAVCIYWALASSQKATAWRVRALSAPPWKIGPAALVPRLQAFEFPEERLASGVLNLPKNVVRPICGKYADFATPIRALAYRNLCSADSTSGRRWSKAEGKPAGTSRGISLSGGLLSFRLFQGSCLPTG